MPLIRPTTKQQILKKFPLDKQLLFCSTKYRVKKSSRRKTQKKTKKQFHLLHIGYAAAIFGALLFVFVVKLTYGNFQTHVLSDSVLLAKEGGGDSGSGDHGGGGSGSSGGDGSNSSGGGSSGGSSGGDGNGGGGSGSSGGGGGEPHDTRTGAAASSLPPQTNVNCTGPDGHQFQTTLQGCSELNRAWNKSNFSFTTNQPQAQQKAEVELRPTGQQKQEAENEIKQKLEVKTENEKTEVKLEKEGTEVEFKQEGDKTVIKAKQPDGTEVELNTHDALEKINEALKDTDVEVGTSAANGFTIKKGEVEAETKLPLSINPLTRELSVTTPAGTKVVAVLPDQAVQNLLSRGVLSSIDETTTTATTGTQPQTKKKVTLTTLNNQPVFEVQGRSKKRLLGIIPVTVQKTPVVSAQTGQVVATNESFFQSILDRLSF